MWVINIHWKVTRMKREICIKYLIPDIGAGDSVYEDVQLSAGKEDRQL